MRFLWFLYFGYVCYVGYRSYRFVMSAGAESLTESAMVATALSAGVCALVLVPYVALSALDKVLKGRGK